MSSVFDASKRLQNESVPTPAISYHPVERSVLPPLPTPPSSIAVEFDQIRKMTRPALILVPGVFFELPVAPENLPNGNEGKKKRSVATVDAMEITIVVSIVERKASAQNGIPVLSRGAVILRFVRAT